MSEQQALYDWLAEDYDLIIDWPARLARETPFLRRLVDEVQANSVLDVGGGTGHHARLLHGWGLEVTLADPSARTLEAARRRLPSSVRIEAVGFEALSDLGRYDLVICLGNTLPHVRDLAEFEHWLETLYGRLQPGGALLCHQHNYRYLLSDFPRRRFLPARGTESVFYLRFFERDGSALRFVVMRVRGQAGGYETESAYVRHCPLSPDHYDFELKRLGAAAVRLYGGFDGADYDAEESEDLIVVARKPERSSASVGPLRR